MKQLHAYVAGRVQGVSFRYYTAQEAMKLGIVGWVRNLPDGKVEVLAEGGSDTLTQLLAFLHLGSPHARVDSVDVEWREAQNEFRNFSIVR